MRASHLFLPPYKKSRGVSRQDATAMLLDGGFVRKTGSGLYAYLPLGMLTLRNFYGLIQTTMHGLDGQEVILPFLNPRSLWEASGRDRLSAADLISVNTKDDQELIINPSHEEAMIGLFKDMIHYTWQLPLFFYQVQGKGRDSSVQAHGMFRAREFITADGFSVHKSFTELNNFIPRVFNAYRQLFGMCGMEPLIAEGAAYHTGGDRSFDFIIRHRWGDYQVVLCEHCNYVADQRVAIGKSRIAYSKPMPLTQMVNDQLGDIKDLATQIGIPESRIAICQLFAALDGLVMTIGRADHQVSFEKIGKLIGDRIIAPLTNQECQDYGFEAIFLSPLGFDLDELRANGVRIVVDHIVAETPNLVMGGNAPGTYYLNTNFGRDFEGHYLGDITMVDEHNHCAHCDGPLKVVNAFELASINRLNDYYSRKLQLKVVAEDGSPIHPLLGTYKIDIHRMITAVAWLRQDQRGLLWPLNLAPYKASLIVVGKSGALHKQADGLHQLMSDLLLWDDRPLSFIQKIRDADRMGIPMRIIISSRTVRDGSVAVLSRTGVLYRRMPINKVKATILQVWKTEREQNGCSDEV